MHGKLALVTGASSGIGESLCRDLVSRGCSVVGIARTGEALNQIQKDLGSLFIPITCDVSDRNSIERVSKSLLAEQKCPSLFFLNAGIAGEKAVENPEKFDLSVHDKIMAVNYFGVLAWVEFWEQPALANGGAQFIATSSVNAMFAPPSGSAYAASKAAVAKAFEGLSLTYFDTNLSFSVVYPGPVNTPGLKGTLPFTWEPEWMAKYMIDCALKGKSRCEPSAFYAVLMRLLRVLPKNLVMSLLKKL
jgi:3-hydroxy acid dehydrogenase/malonic semialdehyde reductase